LDIEQAFCALYPKTMLVNSISNESFNLPEQSNQPITPSPDVLPLSLGSTFFTYVLTNSKVYTTVCLAGPSTVNDLPIVTFSLYRYSHEFSVATAAPLQTVQIKFDPVTLCAKGIINVKRAGVIALALSASASILTESIQVRVDRLYYVVGDLDLQPLNDTSVENTYNHIIGEVGSVLLCLFDCYFQNKADCPLYENQIEIVAIREWNNWALVVLIVLIVLSLIVSLILGMLGFGCCFIGRKRNPMVAEVDSTSNLMDHQHLFNTY